MMLSESLRKAAILVNSLDTQAADSLLDQMTEDEARLVRRAIMELDAIDPDEERAVLEEFVQLNRPAKSSRDELLIERSLPVTRRMRVEPSRDAVPPDSGATPFQFLHHASGDKIMPLLKGEQPQTIALVLSHLPPEQAVEVLSTLDPTTQAAVLQRVANLAETDPEVLRDVERGLHLRISDLSRDEQRKLTGAAKLNRILSAAPEHVRKQLVSKLDREERDHFSRFAPPPRRVTFQELSSWTDTAWRVVLAHAERSIVVLALTDVPAQLVDQVVRLLPVGEQRMIRKTLDNLGPIRLSDVTQAQRELAQLASQLLADGEIDETRNYAAAA